MNQQELETIYEALARAIDEVGAGQGELYLTKAALALAETLDAPATALLGKTGLVNPDSARPC